MGFWDNYWREDTDEKPHPEFGEEGHTRDVFNWEFFVGVLLLIGAVALGMAALGML